MDTLSWEKDLRLPVDGFTLWHSACNKPFHQNNTNLPRICFLLKKIPSKPTAYNIKLTSYHENSLPDPADFRSSVCWVRIISSYQRMSFVTPCPPRLHAMSYRMSMRDRGDSNTNLVSPSYVWRRLSSSHFWFADGYSDFGIHFERLENGYLF